MTVACRGKVCDLLETFKGKLILGAGDIEQNVIVTSGDHGHIQLHPVSIARIELNARGQLFNRERMTWIGGTGKCQCQRFIVLRVLANVENLQKLIFKKY